MEYLGSEQPEEEKWKPKKEKEKETDEEEEGEQEKEFKEEGKFPSVFDFLSSPSWLP